MQIQKNLGHMQPQNYRWNQCGHGKISNYKLKLGIQIVLSWAQLLPALKILWYTVAIVSLRNGNRQILVIKTEYIVSVGNSIMT